MERMLEATITMICADTVNTTELRSAARKLGLCRMLRKFSKPDEMEPHRSDSRVTECVQNRQKQRYAD